MTPISDQAIEEAIVGLVQTLWTVSDVRVIRGEQTKPRPQTVNYVDVRLADFRQVGHGQVGGVDDDGLTPVSGDYQLDIRIRAVGKRAAELINLIQFSFNRPDVIDAFQAAGFAYCMNTDAIHVPMLTDSEWQQRSQITVLFYIEQKQLVDLGYIASIEDVVMTYNGIIEPLVIHSGEIDITT